MEAGEGDFLRGIEGKTRTEDSRGKLKRVGEGEFLEMKGREGTEEIHVRLKREGRLFGEQSWKAGGVTMVGKSMSWEIQRRGWLEGAQSFAPWRRRG